MTDTLILFKPLADFGEALKKECPKNDCTSYLYTYEQYCAIYADYKRIKETIADLSEAAVRVLEHAIRKTEAELYKMWFENYAVLKQRAALGMAASAERRATSSGKTNFEALTADAQGLGRFLRSLPVLEAPYQFAGYSTDYPVLPELATLAADVLIRYHAERDGETNVGRVLPAEYLYFTGDGRNNHFTIGWKDAETWDWCLQNPYND